MAADDSANAAAGPLADWGLAARVAWTVASGRPGPKVTRADVEALRSDLDATLLRADGLAREATGLGEGLPPARCTVVGRRAWVEANLASLAELTDPLSDRVHTRTGGARAVTRAALGLQLGVVFGYLATRVLGQYEVFGPGQATASRNGSQEGRLLLVGPNLLELERSFLPETSVGVEEFRLGICLHEVAHRLQFEGVGWLRAHLRGLVEEYLEETSFDQDRLREAARRLPELLRSPQRLSDPRALIEVLLTPRQAEILDRAQALMSLLEGHGNVVMDWGAAEAGPGLIEPARVREVLNRRRSRAMDRAMRQVMGLSMKAEQYRVGEQFLLAVEERHGRETVNRVWEGPQQIPTPEEFEDPDAWARRVGVG